MLVKSIKNFFIRKFASVVKYFISLRSKDSEYFYMITISNPNGVSKIDLTKVNIMLSNINTSYVSVINDDTSFFIIFSCTKKEYENNLTLLSSRLNRYFNFALISEVDIGSINICIRGKKLQAFDSIEKAISYIDNIPEINVYIENSEYLDFILDKIGSEGVESLSFFEKKFLNRYKDNE